MSTLSRKIDFAVIISVSNANPNGDPLNETGLAKTMKVSEKYLMYVLKKNQKPIPRYGRENICAV